MEQEKLSALRSMAKSLREQGVPVLAIELATKLSAKEIEDL
jgi:hypothetical protein